MTHRSMIVALVIAVVALTVASGALLVLLTSKSDRSGPTVNSVYGSATCSIPHLAGSTVNVSLSNAGDGMMSQEPMMAPITTDPAAAHAGKVSFVASNGGALVHELVVLPLPSDGPGTRPTGAESKINESQSLGEASRS